MNVFLIGMPQSGRSSVGEALDLPSFRYLHISSFLDKSLIKKNIITIDEYHSNVLELMKSSPHIFINEYKKHTHDFISNFIIDGIVSPRDFISLFDYNKDVVVFLNRMDSQSEYQDYQNIAVSVIRDYCFWLSSANLLPRQRWLEFNFKTPGDYDPYLKQMGYKNSVFSVKSLNSVIVNLKSFLTEILEPSDNTQEDLHEV